MIADPDSPTRASDAQETASSARHSTAKRLVCAFMASTALASFARIVEMSAQTGTFGPWDVMTAIGNITGFALLTVKLLRPRDPLTWLYVLLPQLGFLIEGRADAGRTTIGGSAHG